MYVHGASIASTHQTWTVIAGVTCPGACNLESETHREHCRISVSSSLRTHRSSVSQPRPRSQLSTTRLTIEGNAAIRPSGRKPFISPHLRKPLNTPEPLVRFRMCCNACLLVDRPYLHLAIQRATKQVLPCVTPIHRGDPRPMPSQISHLLARIHIVEANNPRVPGRSEKFSSGREGDGTDWLDKPRQRMQHPAGVIAEDVDIPTLMSTCREPAIR